MSACLKSDVLACVESSNPRAAGKCVRCDRPMAPADPAEPAMTVLLNAPPTTFYLAGPMSGLPGNNAKAFEDAAENLRKRGYGIVSPVELDVDEGTPHELAPGTPEYQAALARDLCRVLEVDGIIVLPGWETSRGAALEVHIARELGKPVWAYPALEVLPERHPSSARFHAILRELAGLHDRKQADYGRGDDPFANVRGSEEWGVPGWQGAMVRATDKVRRLQSFALTGTLANEGVIDAFDDLAVYAVIARVLFEEDS